MKKIILTLTALMALSLGARAQYIMKITKADGTVVTMNADDVQSVTFEQAGISGTYEGWTSASAAYFQGMVNKGDWVVIDATGDGAARLTYTSQTWGVAVFEGIAVSEDADHYTLGETDGTITMSGHGGTNDYAATLVSGTVGKQTGSCDIVVKAPSVMGGTTMTFSTENLPAALAVEGSYDGWTSASAVYFQNMNNNGDSVTLAAASATTVNLTYTSQTWGTAQFKGVSITETADGYTLSTEAESTILMPGMGGGEAKEYACSFEGGTLSADLTGYTFTFKAPAVMGGTTMTFRQGTMPDVE